MRSIALFLILGTALHAEDADGKLPFTASSAFGELARQLQYGFLGGYRPLVESYIQKFHLKQKEGGTLPTGQWWGLWEGSNDSGTLTSYASIPAPLDKTHGSFWARYEAPEEKPLPPAVLSHLLSTSRKTEITSGDVLTIEMPYLEGLPKCATRYSLRLRITSGALISTNIEAFCELTAQPNAQQ